MIEGVSLRLVSGIISRPSKIATPITIHLGTWADSERTASFKISVGSVVDFIMVDLLTDCHKVRFKSTPYSDSSFLCDTCKTPARWGGLAPESSKELSSVPNGHHELLPFKNLDGHSKIVAANEFSLLGRELYDWLALNGDFVGYSEVSPEEIVHDLKVGKPNPRLLS